MITENIFFYNLRQGNELRSPSSRILRERNTDRRITTTPRALKQLFTMKRQDEVSIKEI